MNDAAPVLLRRIDMRGASLSPSHLRAALPRGGTDVDAVLPRVRPVVEAVRDRGAEAALDFCAEFDGVRPGTVRVPVAELDRALADLDPPCAARSRWRFCAPGPYTPISAARTP